jgi:hypothetical protein
MGRKPDERKKFLNSETVYSSGIKHEIIDYIFSLHNQQIRFYDEHVDTEFGIPLTFSEIICEFIDRLITEVVNARCIAEIAEKLNNIHSEIKLENVRSSNSRIVLYGHFAHHLDEINSWLSDIYELKNHEYELEKSIPVLDINFFSAKVEELTENITSGPERLDLLRSIKTQIEKFRHIPEMEEGFYELELHRGKKLSIQIGIDADLLDLIIDQKIKQEKIKLIVSADEKKAEFNPEATKQVFKKRFKAIERVGLGFYPFDSFMKSEFIFSRHDIQNVATPYTIFYAKDFSPDKIILVLMSLQGSLFKDSELKNMFCKDLFYCTKQEFKHWLLGLRISAVTEKIVDRLLDKPLKNSDKLFMKEIYKFLSNQRDP